jgi:hypothetical protein
MKKAPYIIMAPPYRNSSAGVRALHELRRHLEERGYEAKIFQGGGAPPEAIVVYPETVSGNPMKGKVVVRYILNHPGLLGGDKEYHSKELIFAYAPLFYPGVPCLTVPVIEDFFRDEGKPREGGCFWVGKGADIWNHDIAAAEQVTGGMTEITYGWPDTREELAALFNNTEAFYSYDDCTAMIDEARRCGCRVVVVPGAKSGTSYDEMIKDFDAQLTEFIRVTQEAVSKLKISFGVMINDQLRFDMVLRRSQIEGNLNFVQNPESATNGLNILLDKAEQEGADICVLCHQDMYFRSGWVDQVRYQISMLPDDWGVAGVIGKDANGIICGKFHDMRIPDHFDTSDIHSFPHPACCFDECVIIVNMKKGFRFDTSLDGFDLYGTLAVLQAWEMGGEAFIIDAFCEHYCLRPFTWFPPEEFRQNYKMLHDRFSAKWKLDSTALGLSPDAKERLDQIRAFMTSAAPFDEEAA